MIYMSGAPGNVGTELVRLLSHPSANTSPAISAAASSCIAGMACE
jgi:hypothetical protein